MINHFDANDVFITATEVELESRPRTYAWRFAKQVREEMKWQWMRQLFSAMEQCGGKFPREQCERSFDIEWSRE